MMHLFASVVGRLNLFVLIMSAEYNLLSELSVFCQLP